MGDVGIVDVAARDGLQNDPAELSTIDKVELITRLARAGVRRVEATSFVSPKAVPKMADAEALIEAVKIGPATRELSLIGLVVNERGALRAVAAGVDEINVVVVATDAFNLRNQSESTFESIGKLGDLVSIARSAALGVSVTIGASFGCPYEGEVPIGRLLEVADAVANWCPDEIALADTIGVAVPADVKARIAAVRGAVGPDVSLRAHFHNTRNTGIANALAAIESGVQALDASLGGIGGCPFAPAATGNIATEDLAYLLERSEIRSGLSLSELINAAIWLGEALDHPYPGMLSKAGRFPRS